MQLTNTLARAAGALTLSLAITSAAAAQARVVLPQGSVILVRTQTALESSTARQGQTFETTVEDTVGIDNYTVIPGGSRIRGVVTYVQPANRQQSGVIEVDFDRLTLPDGTSYAIKGKLTSTDPVERRQIDSTANQRVVLVGGRGGIGAAIAGAGSQNNPASSLLGALGTLLSEGRDVNVPAGTSLAVQLEQNVLLPRRALLRNPDQSTIYTSSTMIAAAQRALAAQNYYRGTISGQMNYATQRALFEFQSDKNLSATGNLDWRTAQLLGLDVGSPNGGLGAILSASEAATLRRNAQSLVGRERQELAVTSIGRVNSSRPYTEADVNLWFALSAFADNASLYEQVIQGRTNSNAAISAGRALLDAARRVDSAMTQARPTYAVRNGWTTIRNQLSGIDASYIQ